MGNLTAKSYRLTANKGFSLVEVLLAVSIFGLLLLFLTGGLIYGQQSTALSGARARAEFLAEEGLEAEWQSHSSHQSQSRKMNKFFHFPYRNQNSFTPAVKLSSPSFRSRSLTDRAERNCGTFRTEKRKNLQ